MEEYAVMDHDSVRNNYEQTSLFYAPHFRNNMIHMGCITANLVMHVSPLNNRC
jgi:hypothetical protein